MNVFIAIDVNDNFKNLKIAVDRIDKQIGINKSKLPLHISLMMPFEIEDEMLDNLISDVNTFFKERDVFNIYPKGIENVHTICWLRMKESKIINDMHDDLLKMIVDKYHIKPHEYDYDYKFHCTLFLNEDANIIDKGYELIKNEMYPEVVNAKNICLGISDSGLIGTYHIYHKFELRS